MPNSAAMNPGRPRRAARSAALILPAYAGTLFLSAFLLFSVQPMLTKMVLPRLGGSPAVWNTAMVFFQATLLAGYFYVHLSTRFLGLRAQFVTHAALLLVAFLFLPVALGGVGEPPAEGTPVFWLLGVLPTAVGLPFLAVSATAPLLQKWFAHIDHPSAHDPYFLYGGSNLGSLAALLAYPLLIESALGLGDQGRWWTAGYLALAAAIAACGWMLRRHYSGAGQAGAGSGASSSQSGLVAVVTLRLRLRWLLLALVPSALLLGATLHVGTDIAAAPFLWVLPLALYLLSFVLVFARRPLLPHRWMIYAQALWLVLVAVLFETPHLYVLLVLHIGGVFFTAMVCHGELARLRPVASRLTEFYLWLSLGGLAGGVLAGIVAPLIFNSVYEYPLAMLAAILLRPWPRRDRGVHRWALDLLLPVGVFVLLLDGRWREWTGMAVTWAFDHNLGGMASYAAGRFPPWEELAAAGAFVGGTILMVLALSGRPLRFALGVVAVLAVLSPDVLGTIRYRVDNAGSARPVWPLRLAWPLAWNAPEYRQTRVRSFFGVYSVNYLSTDAGEHHILVNGTTNHGAQNLTYPQLPITYYAREGPVGQAFSVMRMGDPPKRIGVIGLGIGSLSCFLEAGQRMTFFEIDPVEAQIANDPRFFTYLSECGRGRVDIVIGDGRRNIAKESDGAFDVILVDAFSGDAIPVHLLTREAIELYMRKLSPGGMLFLHITNTYVDLRPVVANIVAATGLHARAIYFNGQMMTPFGLPSEWIVAARPAENDLVRFTWQMQPWQPLLPDPGHGVWTDDHSNLLRSLRWGEYGVIPLRLTTRRAAKQAL